MKTIQMKIKTSHWLQMLLFIPAILSFGTVFLFSWWEHDKTVQEMIHHEGELLMRQLTVASRFALTANDPARLKEIVASLADAPEIRSIRLLNHNNRAIFDYESDFIYDDSFYEYSQLILDESVEPVALLGAIKLQMSKQYYLDNKNILLTSLIPIILIYSFVLMLVGLWHRRTIATPIDAAIRSIHLMKHGTAISVTDKLGGEIGHLIKNINALSEHLQKSKEQDQKQKRALKSQVNMLARSQQETLDALNSNEGFLNILNEEIRGPVNTIKLMLNMIANTKSATLKERYLHSAEKNADYLEALVEEASEFTRLASGQFDFNAQPCDPHMVIEECVESLNELSKEKKVRLTIEPLQLQIIDNHLIHTDPNYLAQVIINLLHGAIMHPNIEQIVLKQPWLQSTADKVSLNLTIEMFGGKALNPAQLDQSVTITVAKRILENLSGDLTVASEHGNHLLMFNLEIPVDVIPIIEPERTIATGEQPNQADMLFFSHDLREANLIKSQFISSTQMLETSNEFDRCGEIYLKYKTSIVILEISADPFSQGAAAEIRTIEKQFDIEPCLLVALYTDHTDSNIVIDTPQQALFDLVLPKPDGILTLYRLLADLGSAKMDVDIYLDSLCLPD